VLRTRWAYIGSLWLALRVSASAFGQATVARSDSAGAALSSGELAYSQGRFGDALDAFEASYRKQPTPPTLRRIADAADKLGSHARALQALQAYLKYMPNTPDREYIASRIAANRAALDAYDSTSTPNSR
jgi:tetratricopeptide (TPR) repeat protein